MGHCGRPFVPRKPGVEMDSQNAGDEKISANKPSKPVVFVDWIMPQHFESVVELFNDCFSDQHGQMSVGRLEDIAKQPRMMLAVASTSAERSINSRHPCCAYIMYSKQKSRLAIESIAVHPARRRSGIGSALVSCAKQQINTTRPRIIAEIADDNQALDIHLFFRACGFRAIALNANRDHDSEIVFEYRRDRESPFLYSPGAGPISAKNRISQ